MASALAKDAPSPPSVQWEVFTDEQGNIYFYNAVTGESVWELPSEEEELDDSPAINDACRDDANAELCALAFDHADARDTPARHKGEFSAFEIAIDVIDTMIAMLGKLDDGGEIDASASRNQMSVRHGAPTSTKANKRKKQKKFVSPAAEARFMKNQAIEAKKKKRLREKAMATYLRIVIPPVLNVAHDSEGSHEGQSSLPKATPSNVGTLFTLEDTIRWRLEREVEQIKQRRAIRKERQRHQKQVLLLKRQQEMLIRFRTELTRYFLSQIECSTELQKQRILLLSSPQQLAEMEAKRKRAMEPEIAERCAKEQQTARADNLKNAQKVFVLIDEAAQGKLHLLQILFGVFTLERLQQYALKVRGLSELISSLEIQKFVFDFVSRSHDDDVVVTMDEFVEFVAIIEDVTAHYTSVKTAVKEAEDEIEATLEAAAAKPGTSLLRARVGIVSKKKVEQEIAALKASEEQIRLRQEQEQQDAFRFDEGFALASKEVWEKNHHHRFISFGEYLPLYCCLCRRRKWELARREHEECESKHRSRWSSRCALKAKEEELKLVEKDAGTQPVEKSAPKTEEVDSALRPSPAVRGSELLTTTATAITSTHPEGETEEDSVVYEILRSLVTLTERLVSQDLAGEAKSPKRRIHKQRDQHAAKHSSPRKKAKSKKSKISGSEADAQLQRAMHTFESEENERKAMHVEEVQMMLFLERSRRVMERPLLQIQDAAHNSYIRMLSHIVNPTSFLYRLQFLRCLRFTSPQQLVLQMLDRSENAQSDGSSANHFILHTVPCRSESEGNYLFKQLKLIEEKLRSPYVATVVSVSKHTFQFFANSGMLVECWPVLFVAAEHFPAGSWLQHFRKRYLDDQDEDNSARAYADMEQHLFTTFREVAAGLSAMHSLKILHLNINLDNIYVSHSERSERHPHVRISGFLAFKVAFTDEQLTSGVMRQCIDYSIAPPEALQDHKSITAKADVWMLGCALYEALTLWQTQQLRTYTANRSESRLEGEKVIVHLKTLQEVLQEIPISASATMRSLLRMLLQPNPAQRPQMSQVLDYLSFAEKQNLMHHG